MTVRGLSGRVERLEAVDKVGGREPIVIEMHHEMSHDEALQMLGMERSPLANRLLIFVRCFFEKPGLPRVISPAPQPESLAG